MLKPVYCLVFLVMLCQWLHGDWIKAEYPADGATVSPLKVSQRMYALMDEADYRKLYEEDLWFTERLYKDEETLPKGIDLSWDFHGERNKITYEVRYADNPEFQNAVIVQPKHRNCTIHNLEIGRKYYWRASACYQDGSRISTEVQSFVVEDLPPRLMNVPGIYNCRDLGGRTGLEGKTAKQGMIFRNIAMNNIAKDGTTLGGPFLTAEGERIMREDLKIRTDLDLRSPSETGLMTKSPLGDDINYVHISALAYDGIYSEAGKANYAEIFRVFCDRDNYPIDMHCIAGADRTGTVAFLLGAVLGYSVHDLMCDYTMTSFCTQARTTKLFDSFYQPLNEYGTPDEPLSLKAERYLVLAGITPDEIQAFRDIMLGPGTTVSSGTIAYYENLVKAEPQSSLPVRMSIKTTDVKHSVFCGENYDVSSLSLNSDDTIAASDGQGGYLFSQKLNYARNDAPLVLSADTSALADQTYTITCDELKIIYTHDGNPLWTPNDLNSFVCQAPTVCFVLHVRPGTDFNPDYARIENLKSFDYHYIGARATEVTPVIDGELDDEIWAATTFHPMSVNGLFSPGNCRREVAFAFNQDASVIYIAIRFEDQDPVWKGTQKDGNVYEGDCVEMFLSAMNTRDYYQFVFNGEDIYYDGFKINQPQWDSEPFQHKSRLTDQGWQMETAIPLAQFKFTAPLEFNIGSNDFGSQGLKKLYALWNPFGSLHTRAAMKPLLAE